MLVRVLIMVDERALEKRLRRLLDGLDVVVASFAAKSTMQAEIERESSDLILLLADWIEDPPATTLQPLRDLEDRPEILVLVDAEDAHVRARLLAAGALAVVNTSLSDSGLKALLAQSVRRRTESMLSRLTANRESRVMQLADFVSASPAMQAFLETVYKIVDADNSLLILGETGVGKEHLARAIHMESRRSSHPFVSINCGALPEHLLESELFGHEEGAFTGATRPHRGQFELAHRGTLFLDEIGEMPPHLQVKLLQALERRQIRRVGGERVVDIDVRVLAATNRNLSEAMVAGAFRQDLYFRLGALALTIPPLRERQADIPGLVESYLEHFRVATGRDIRSIAPAALEAMTHYPWPGNVRELINVIERMVLLGRGSVLTMADLPPAMTSQTVATSAENNPNLETLNTLPVSHDLPLNQARQLAVDAFERSYFTHLLTRTHGHIGETAKLAGITPRSLYDRLRRQGLDKDTFKQ